MRGNAGPKSLPEGKFEAILITFEGLPSKSEFVSEGHKAVPTYTAPDDDEDRCHTATTRQNRCIAPAPISISDV